MAPFHAGEHRATGVNGRLDGANKLQTHVVVVPEWSRETQRFALFQPGRLSPKALGSTSLLADCTLFATPGRARAPYSVTGLAPFSATERFMNKTAKATRKVNTAAIQKVSK